MTIAPLTIHDTFSRGVSDAWGTTDTGQVWAKSGTQFDVVSGLGVMHNAANAARLFNYIDLPAHSIPNQSTSEVLMRVRYGGTAAWPLTDFGPTLSFNGATNTGYYLALQGNYSEISIGCFINGSRYEIARKSAYLTKNVYFWVRFKQTSTGLFAKVWEDGKFEPTAWTLSTTLWTGGNPPAAGSFGVFRMGTRDTYDADFATINFYTSEDAEPTGDVIDLFDRITIGTFGISNSKHVWQGSFSDDPEYITKTRIGNAASGASAQLQNTDAVQGFLGPIKSGDIEAYGEFTIGAATGTGDVSLYLRSTRGKVGGAPAVLSGYCVRYRTDNTLEIMKRTDASTITSLTSASITAIPINTKMAIRFQIIGTTLQARAWQFSLTEPATWNVSTTDTTFTSGVLGLQFQQSAVATRWFSVHKIQRTPPSISNINAVTSGTGNYTPYPDHLVVTGTYTGDANNSSTAQVRYKPVSSNTWSAPLDPSSIDRGTKVFTFDVNTLTPDTPYHIEINYLDVDGVVGSNPMLYVFTTTAASLRTKGLVITGSTPTSLSVEASYELDSDTDSTAAIEVRTISADIDLVEDYFVDEREGFYLQNATPVQGGAYVKHPSMTPTANAVRGNMYYYANMLYPNELVLYRQTTTIPLAEYEIKGTFRAEALQGRTGLAGRLSDVSNTYYGAGINAQTNTWELFKMVAGVKTILGTSAFSGTLGVVYDVKLVIKNAYKSVLLNDVEIIRSTDNTITSAGYAGYYSTAITSGVSTNQFLLGSLVVTYRSSASSWTSYGAMIPDRVNKKFTKTLSPLDDDLIYELRVTYTDADGVVGNNPLMLTTQIVGQSSSLTLMGYSASDTSVVLSIFYTGDSNSNSYIELQHRAATSTLWETVSFSKFRTDRITKRFDLTLAGLIPNTTYNIRAVLVDPDGISNGGQSVLTGLFSTSGTLFESEKQGKHFLWKVYDRKDVYVGTIPDAPEPEFSILENGGVTDLTFTLSRKNSELQSHGFIDFQHRVDIWAVDPSSYGMGPNLMDDADCDPAIGAWVFTSGYGQNASYDPTGGPDGSSAIRISQANTTQYETSSGIIEVAAGIPLYIASIARARGAKLRMYVRAYNINDVAIDTSDYIETVGVDWQTISLEYIPPTSTAYIRVILRNTGKGTMWADKFKVFAKEMLIYRGRIETFTPKIDQDGESVSIDVLGIASLLSDDYIEFLQFVETQPTQDVEAGRLNYGAKDPADMLKKIVDELRRANPFFTLYYTTESIRYTGNLMQYTFRDQQARACFDDIRTLCPAGWHYAIEPDGLVILRGPESAPTHTLHIGRETQDFEVEKSIRNLKNYIRVKGRQDEDGSEADGYGSINYIAFDQASIDKYGKRVLFIRDAQLTDPESAKIVGDGRLDEVNREEQRATIKIPDEKGFYVKQGPLIGYNIESFRAGDNVIVVDPIAGPRNSYWNQFVWDEDVWDSSNVFTPLPEAVPIKSIKYRGEYVELELSERPPSAVGDFSKFYRWMANKNRED